MLLFAPFPSSTQKWLPNMESRARSARFLHVLTCTELFVVQHQVCVCFFHQIPGMYPYYPHNETVAQCCNCHFCHQFLPQISQKVDVENVQQYYTGIGITAVGVVDVTLDFTVAIFSLVVVKTHTTEILPGNSWSCFFIYFDRSSVWGNRTKRDPVRVTGWKPKPNTIRT